jgi:hypothetical protein
MELVRGYGLRGIDAMKDKPSISTTALAILRRIAAKNEMGELLINDSFQIMRPALKQHLIELTPHTTAWFRVTDKGRAFLKESP